MLEPDNEQMTLQHQCELVGIPRSTYYFHPRGESEENLNLMRAIDKYHTDHPAIGSRPIAKELGIGRNRARRLMRLMGIETIYPKPKTTHPDQQHQVYPYLLRNLEITGPNQVWSTDITYIPMAKGFVYLTAVIDWYSRYILSWRLSNTLDKAFCIEALEDALATGQKPEIFNTDQGSQYTSIEFTDVLKRNGIRISMDGRNRALDNVFIERFWRTVKYEEIYINHYENVWELEDRLRDWFDFYCHRRHHSSLNYRCPADVYFGQSPNSIAGEK